MSWTATLTVLILAAVALALVPFWAPGYKTTLATEMLIFALLAMSVDIMEGYAGRTTLCHGALFGVSTYVLLYHVVEHGGSVCGRRRARHSCIHCRRGRVRSARRSHRPASTFSC